MIGIYRIVHAESGRCYIGSSGNVKARLRRHKHDLGLGLHANKHLQNAWNKYGAAAFYVEIVEEVSEANSLLDHEQRHLDAAWPHVFNCSRIASSPGSARKGMPLSKAHAEAIRTSLQRPEVRQAISDGVRKAFPSGRPPLSEKNKLSMSLARTGKKRGPHSDVHRERLTKALRMPEIRAKISTGVKRAMALNPRRWLRNGRAKGSLSPAEIAASSERLIAINHSRKGYKQSPEHLAKRVAAWKATRERRQREKVA